MKWRPIKTAPKDGTAILVAEPNPGGTDQPWLVIEARWIDVPQDGACQAFPGFYAAYPAIYSGGPGGSSWTCKPVVCIKASHGMPKPAPPKIRPDRTKGLTMKSAA